MSTVNYYLIIQELIIYNFLLKLKKLMQVQMKLKYGYLKMAII